LIFRLAVFLDMAGEGTAESPERPPP
jgi:hypothetical protein